MVNCLDPPPGPVIPPLITAVLDRQTETVRQLLASGADTSAIDHRFHNALYYATMAGLEETLLLLLHNGATGAGSNLTALDLAVVSDKEVVGKILIGRGATIEHNTLSDYNMEDYNRWAAEFE